MDIIFAMTAYTVCFIMVTMGIWISSKNEKSILMKIINNSISLILFVMPTWLKNGIETSMGLILYTRNPLMQVIYILLLSLGYSVYTFTAYPYMNETVYGHIPFLLLGINLSLFVSCSVMNPGVVTSENVQEYINEYPYDQHMYHEKTYCPTCHLEKPARSKHCGICDRCVSRFDHHCSWINNCVARRTHKVFVLFIFSLVVITFTAAFLVAMVFLHITHQRSLHKATFTDRLGNIFEPSLSTIITFLIGEYTLMSLLLLCLIFLWAGLTCFFCFHLFLIVTNQTTNEICKQRKMKSSDAIMTEKVASSSRLKKSDSGGRRRSRRVPVNKHNKDKNSSRLANAGSMFGVYSRGIVDNILEVFAR